MRVPLPAARMIAVGGSIGRLALFAEVLAVVLDICVRQCTPGQLNFTRRGWCPSRATFTSLLPSTVPPRRAFYAPGKSIRERKLADLDSNQDKQNQNLLCYRYTIGQSLQRNDSIPVPPAEHGASVLAAWIDGGEF